MFIAGQMAQKVVEVNISKESPIEALIIGLSIATISGLVVWLIRRGR